MKVLLENGTVGEPIETDEPIEIGDLVEVYLNDENGNEIIRAGKVIEILMEVLK